MNQEFVGRYRLQKRLTVGGMAEVWLALEQGPGNYKRPVIIKKILPQYSTNDEFRRMFEAEAAVLSRLNHSNIAQIYEYGIADEPFLAMEYVEGRDLRAILEALHNKQSFLPVPMAVFIAAEVAKGLGYAHLRKDGGQLLNIIHRDVSPQNIMISISGEVKIIDFGIAKSGIAKAAVTQAGTIKGKYAYMSPEQASGARDLDARTDVFSLGIVLWEMLTGKRLFARTEDAATLNNVLKAAARPPHEVNSNVPVELSRVVMTALARDRNDRYPDMKEFYNALVDVLYIDSRMPEPSQLAGLLCELFPEIAASVFDSSEPAETSDEPKFAVTVLDKPGGAAELLAQAEESTALERPARVAQPVQHEHQLPPLLDPGLLPAYRTGADAAGDKGPYQPGADKGRVLARYWLAGLLSLVAVALVVAVGVQRSRHMESEAQAVAEADVTEVSESSDAASDLPEPLIVLVDRPSRGTAPVLDGAVDMTMTFILDPPDAVLRVDGDRVTPGTVKLRKAPGQVMNVEAHAAGHLPKKQTVDAEEGKTVGLSLEKSGRIVFFVSPGNAQVEIDGEPAIGSRRVFGYEGAVGDSVNIRVHLDGYKSFEETVVIEAGTWELSYLLSKTSSKKVSAVLVPDQGGPGSDEPPDAVPSPKEPEKLAAKPQAVGPSKVADQLPQAEQVKPEAPQSDNVTRKETRGTNRKPKSGQSGKEVPGESNATGSTGDSGSAVDAGKGGSVAGGADTKPAVGTISVQARPYAEIYYAGKNWGRTPRKIEVGPGRHTIELRHPAGRHSCQLEVVAGQTVECSYDFAKEPEKPESGSGGGSDPEKTP